MREKCVRAMKAVAKVVSIERRARLLSSLLPPEDWFRAAILMSRWQAQVSSLIWRRGRGVSEAYLRDNWLTEFSRLGEFPIPVRVTGAELLASTDADRGGVVLCSTHVPLLLVVMRVMVLTGHKPDVVVVDPDNMRVGNTALQPAGLMEGVAAASPGPKGLLRIRTVLRNRGLVACTLDRQAGGPSHPDLLVLAGRLGARTVTFWTELGPDGVVIVAFKNAVHPYCDSVQAIEENIEAMLDDERRLLAKLNGVEQAGTPVSGSAESRAPASRITGP